MENFNKILKDLRKANGLTQEQLAEAVGVSPQSVSKWEISSYPDPSLLPAIADRLGVSIDELFGRSKEEEPFLDRLVKYIASFPEEELCAAGMNVCRAIPLAFCGAPFFDPLHDSIYKRHNKFDAAYSQITTDYGWCQSRNQEDLYYFLMMNEPEHGYDEVLDYKEEYVELFRFLSVPNALRAMYFLEGRDETMFFSVETLMRELGTDKENAEEIVERMNKLGFLWNADFNTGAKNERIYQYTSGRDFLSFITFAHILLHRPHSFNYQANTRTSSAFFKNDTYKNIPKSQREEDNKD